VEQQGKLDNWTVREWGRNLVEGWRILGKEKAIPGQKRPDKRAFCDSGEIRQNVTRGTSERRRNGGLRGKRREGSFLRGKQGKPRRFSSRVDGKG